MTETMREFLIQKLKLLFGSLPEEEILGTLSHFLVFVEFILGEKTERVNFQWPFHLRSPKETIQRYLLEEARDYADFIQKKEASNLNLLAVCRNGQEIPIPIEYWFQ